MMDDTLSSKHHINPLAQFDSLKDAQASPPPRAEGKSWADCEEEAMPVRKHGEPDRLVQFQEIERRG